VGTLFAGGHSIMVLAIAALVGLLGTRFRAYGTTIEQIGTVISIVVLIAIAIVNFRQLRAGAGMPSGVRTRLLPAPLRTATSALAAIPVGLLFGFGFETSSQIATYTVAFSIEAGVLGALGVGAAFCAGMIASDTLDSVLVHRLIERTSAAAFHALRVWITAVTLVALVVAAYETLQLFGWQSPFPDIALSAAICAALAAVFVYVFARTHTARSVAPRSGGEPIR
jgi:high-affinity nickel-transport protein